jgi:hypothetical protein
MGAFLIVNFFICGKYINLTKKEINEQIGQNSFPKPVENFVECVENLANQGGKSFFEKFACGKLLKKSCQVFFKNFYFSPLCTNRHFFTEKERRKNAGTMQR